MLTKTEKELVKLLRAHVDNDTGCYILIKLKDDSSNYVKMIDWLKQPKNRHASQSAILKHADDILGIVSYAAI